MAKLFEYLDQQSEEVKNGDDVIYLLLLQFCPTSDNEENIREWCFKKGRQYTYDFIRDLLLGEDKDSESTLDVDASIIYADNPHIPQEANKLRLSNGISIYKFMKDCYVLQKVKDEGGFDIEDFHVEEDEI